ncbi:bone morphogenetic protein 1-like isoform X3 [Haliotis rubra]|uniref:bone morphogenetic protein 1-like isoform X3 n=1 Tax=Haliotis rubra TaxID=36100 RepID=UPI001EE536F7|nr:bone morphogenetic protein 1-like isoform X3 [Haliotis rubra]
MATWIISGSSWGMCVFKHRCPSILLAQEKLRCTFEITAEEGERIQAVVLVFDGKYGIQCRYDRVNIFDGFARYSQRLNEACAVRTNFTATSSTRYMRVEFTMMFTLLERGFKMMYTSGIFAVSKHVDLTADSYIDSILSPGYPGLYGGTYHLTWRIYSGLLTEAIRVAVEESHLPYNPNCSSDYLEVYDGYDSSNTSLAKWCGDERPSVESSGPHVFIEFRASGSKNHGVFVIKYSIIVELKPPNPHNPHNPQDEFETIFTVLATPLLVFLILSISLSAWIIRQKRRHRSSNTVCAVIATTRSSDPVASDYDPNHRVIMPVASDPLPNLEAMMPSTGTGGETELPPPYTAVGDSQPPPSYDSLFCLNSGKC